MFKVVLTAMDSNANVKPYDEEIGPVFDSHCRAENYLLRAVNEELSQLNSPDANNTPHTRVFIADLEGDHEAVIRLWDGEDSWDVSYYDIIEIEKEQILLDKYNSMLKERYGQDITVEIKSYIEADDSEWFFYTSALHGDSDSYETIEEAYEEATLYLCGSGELW